MYMIVYCIYVIHESPGSPHLQVDFLQVRLTSSHDQRAAVSGADQRYITMAGSSCIIY